MSNFGEARTLAGLKDHRCEWCGEKIPKGERHYHFKGMWEGCWQNWRMHLECESVSESEDGFEPFQGERPAR